MTVLDARDPTWSSPSLLLVDDDPDDTLFFEMALHECARHIGFHHAVDGREAMELLEKNSGWTPDLILTDLKMPGVNGFEMLQMLRNHPAYCKVPVVVFSSSGELVDRERSLALGARDYHVKPAGYQKLVAEVRTICWWLVSYQAETPAAVGADVHASRADWSGKWDESGFSGPISPASLKPIQQHGSAF